MPQLPQSMPSFLRMLRILLIAGCAAGCSTPHYSARSLPETLRAHTVAGTESIRLGALNPSGGSSQLLGHEDLVEMTIETGLDGEEPLVHRVRVEADGAIEAPMIGRVHVAGLEPAEAGQRVALTAVRNGVYVRPTVSLRVEQQATHRVTVLGAVAEPGQIELPRGGCDVLAAVAAAGGFTDEAGSVVEVLHNEQAGLTLSDSAGPTGVVPASFAPPNVSPASGAKQVRQIDLAGAAPIHPRDLDLKDRDVIVVREKHRRVVYVSGLVERPDQFELEQDQDLRVLDALAMAGGVSSPVADRVLVIRQTEGAGEPAVIEVSLSRAKSDGEENLLLSSGDLVSVESTASTVAFGTFQNLFRITMGVGGNLTLF